MLRSQLCSAESLRSPELRAWAGGQLRPMWASGPERRARRHAPPQDVGVAVRSPRRLRERGLLAAGPGRPRARRRPGAARSRSFAGPRAATSSPPTSRAAPLVASGWTDSGGRVGRRPRAARLRTGCAPTTLFARRVRFRPVDMNAIPADLRGFDFTWSSCALERLGTLAAGADFVVAQIGVPRSPAAWPCTPPSTWSASNDETVEAGGTVFYRRRDIEAPGGPAAPGRARRSTSTSRSGPRPRTSTSTWRPTPTSTCAPGSAPSRRPRWPW